MSFAAPVFAWVAAGVALATAALHLLAWRRPPALLLPTARFAPDAPVRTVARAVRPADLALLALRVLLVLLVGGALAGPTFAPHARGGARVLVVDRSRAARQNSAVSDVARTAFRGGDALVVFDSAAREVVNPAMDSIGGASALGGPGSVSAALIVAIRAAKRLQREHGSVEIVLVSPFASDELDAATASIRRTWPGAVRAMRAGSAPNDTSRAGRPSVRATGGDAVAAALALSGEKAGGGDVHVVRDAIMPSDSAWARNGHAVVLWPSSVMPPGWRRRLSPDTSFAVSVLSGAGAASLSRPGSATVVAPLVRVMQPPPGFVVARWADGEPAATEISLGAGCIRSVAVTVPPAGDLALTPAFRRFAESVTGRCDGARTWAPVPDSTLAAVLPPTMSRESMARVVAEAPRQPVKNLAALLLGLALLAALAELVFRRGAADATG